MRPPLLNTASYRAASLTDASPPHVAAADLTLRPCGGPISILTAERGAWLFGCRSAHQHFHLALGRSRWNLYTGEEGYPIPISTRPPASTTFRLTTNDLTTPRSLTRRTTLNSTLRH